MLWHVVMTGLHILCRRFKYHCLRMYKASLGGQNRIVAHSNAKDNSSCQCLEVFELGGFRKSDLAYYVTWEQMSYAARSISRLWSEVWQIVEGQTIFIYFKSNVVNILYIFVQTQTLDLIVCMPYTHYSFMFSKGKMFDMSTDMLTFPSFKTA